MHANLNMVSQGLKLTLVVIGSHALRWLSERLYYEQCAGFFTSIFAHGSPTCHGLRWVADSVSLNSVAIVGSATVKALALVYEK